MHHFADEFDHLLVVFKHFDVFAYFLDGVTRLQNECLHLSDLLLNSVEEQIVALPFSRLDRGNDSGVLVFVLWPINLDKVLFAFVEDVANSSIGFLAQL